MFLQWKSSQMHQKHYCILFLISNKIILYYDATNSQTKAVFKKNLLIPATAAAASINCR